MEQHHIWIFWLLLMVKTELTSLSKISAQRCCCWIEHSYLLWCFLNQCTYSYSHNLPSQPLCDGSLLGDYVSSKTFEPCRLFDNFLLFLNSDRESSPLFDKNLIFGEIWWVHYPETFHVILLFVTLLLSIIIRFLVGIWINIFCYLIQNIFIKIIYFCYDLFFTK
jgi:hypothetical protein